MTNVTQLKITSPKDEQAQKDIDVAYPKNHSDEKLFRLIKERQLLVSAFNISPDGSDEASDYFIGRINQLDEKIMKESPASFEGLKCKAKMIWDDWLGSYPVISHCGGDALI